jgi:non-homologous end joining protein Ku
MSIVCVISISIALSRRAEIDRRFFDTPYYVTPNDPVGQDAFAVIREAMRSKALVAPPRSASRSMRATCPAL